jgi:cytidyltransferase-like protein
MKIVICSGGFDPLHNGHIEYFKSAKLLGDFLVVALNSDEWLERKKGKAFMDWPARYAILSELKTVDNVIAFNDSDDSARDAITKVKTLYPTDDIVFVNGGDRTLVNIPEMTEDGIEFAFSVGGNNKVNSSSWVLKAWEDWILTKHKEVTIRNWGYYEVLQTVSEHIKVKRLVIFPGKSLSYQKHIFRNEFWIAETGTANVLLQGKSIILNKGDYLIIKQDIWHQIQNLTDTNVIIFEVQYGDKCEELDILRA